MTPLPYPEHPVPSPFPSDDGAILRLLVEAATRHAARGGGPFAAALVGPDGRPVEFNVNRVVETGDPTAHAEQVVLRNGFERLRGAGLAPSGGELRGYTLFSSAEPCCGCRGAVYLYAPSRIVWAASADEVESAGGFYEGPRHDAFWDEIGRRRGVTASPRIDLGPSSLEPFAVHRAAVAEGRSREYLKARPDGTPA